jgi:hypothetical protein
MEMFNFTEDQISDAFISALSIKDLAAIIRRSQSELSDGETLSFCVVIEKLIAPAIEILESLDWGDHKKQKNIPEETT